MFFRDLHFLCDDYNYIKKVSKKLVTWGQASFHMHFILYFMHNYAEIVFRNRVMNYRGKEKDCHPFGRHLSP